MMPDSDVRQNCGLQFPTPKTVKIYSMISVVWKNGLMNWLLKFSPDKNKVMYVGHKFQMDYYYIDQDNKLWKVAEIT